MFGLTPFRMSHPNQLSVQMDETDSAYVVNVQYPRIDENSVTVEYVNHHLIIHGKREEFMEDKRKNFIRQERYYSEFSRTFYIGNADGDNLQTSYEKGFLKVTLPKKK
ncbi:hypothetical protein BHU72_05855 [Desulfuribacillus stibiiarsenatis]|uniref:SHSP domain-containing protein n=1 Tax=Desulfuribacillus stibiiarsenatis TaxID=1390249 RepID=A0A1E5L4Z5_9FIRM|nr:Hsp20 family protein [Desulfuribacillus stibiiarsenatis]OEH85134.1 hypothetical protein BHU72_05855 [Desulfuribacillus stibiiarsenatis]